MRKKLVMIGVLSVVLAFVAACESEEELDAKARAEAATSVRTVPVEAVVVSRRDIRETLQSTAAVDSRQAVDVVAEIPGTVVALDVEQGDEVEENQRLAQIQREELNLGAQAASTAVKRLEQEVERLRPLLEKGVVSRQMFDEAQYRVDEARGEQRRARLAVGDTRVTSPMDGVIALRSVSLGQQVATGVPLFRVVDPSDLIVHVNLPETSLSKVYEEQRAYVESEALGNVNFDARVQRISPVVDPRTGTLRVTLEVLERVAEVDEPTEGAPTIERRLRPGMFVQTFIVIDERAQSLVVPRRAIRFVDQQATVFRVEDGIAIRRAVTTGIAEGSWIEVVDGLSEDDVVVVLGHDGLKDGTAVDVELREPRR